MPAARRPRGFWAGVTAALLVVTGLGAVSTVAAPPAYAAPNLLCTGSTVYATNQAAGDGDLWQIDTTTGAASEVLDLPGGDIVNQVGIAPGGGRVFFTKAGVIYNYAVDTETFVSTPAQVLDGYNTVGGAVNPANGRYYYGGLGLGGTGYQIAVYDPATNTNLGVAATIQLPEGITFANSDFAFDTLGQVYIVGSTSDGGAVVRVDGTVPGTAANATLGSSLLTTIEQVAGVSYAGIGFSGTGDLYIGGGAGSVLSVNATTGELVGSVPITGAPGMLISDFATCGAPPTLTVQKNVEGRLQPTDQFGLAITGGGIAAGPGSTGTTEGTETGLQTQAPEERAGSVIVQPDETYDFAESAAGTTTLSNYVARWECADANGAAGNTISSGSGTSGSITIPEIAGIAVVCTIFNDPLVPGMTLDKRVTETIDANENGYTDVGDRIRWEFELTNTGETTLAGLVVTDDKLAAAGIGVTCDPDVLPVGESVVCTADGDYTITTADLDAGRVVNTATATGTPPGQPPVTTPPDTTETLVGGYTVVKTADPVSGTAVESGDIITYTLTVAHQGTAAVTGATLTDDLSAVLDDATYNDDAQASSGSVSFAAGTGALDWEGDLAVGAVVTITYSVTVGSAGDGELVNAVTSPGCGTQCTTTHLRGAYSVTKASDPVSGSSVQAGDVVTYTLTVTQAGPGAVSGATLDDDLSDVLDDATYNGDATASAGALTFLPGSGALSWEGDLAVGAVVTITYSVTVTGDGDTTLTNVVDSPGCSTACTTEHLVGAYSVVKSSDPAAGTTVAAGDRIDYTIVVTQQGAGAVADAELSDDLTAVLDDADYNDDLEATAGDAGLTGASLTWSGALGVGTTVTITYSVTVTGEGDGALTNVVTSPGCGADCSTSHSFGDYAVTKTADPASGAVVAEGDVITYTLTVTQEGPGTVTGATLADDLADVLDDGDYNGDAAATIGTPVVDAAAGTLVWTADLAVGDVAVITYSITVTGAGDGTITNAVTSPGCASATACATEHLRGGYDVVKTSDPGAGATVAVGQTVDYTITVRQIGPGTVTGASVTDDLSGVLDDATYNDDVVADTGAASIEGSTLSWSSDLAVGDVVTIRYSVTVGAVGSGDGVLRNVVSSSGCDTDDACTTAHPIGAYVFSKTADPASGSTVAVGGTVTYTIIITQTGTGPVVGARVDDDLSDVLDDARLTGPATASAGTVDREGNALRWTGDLDIGDTVTVTYAVEVTGGGDGRVRNLVSTTDPAGSCDPDAACVTTHRVPPPAGLAVTGGGLALAGVGAAGALLILGVWLAVRGRRRQH